MENTANELTRAEVLRLGNIYRSSLYQRQQLDYYFLPTQRHVTSRATIPLRLPPRPLPADALMIGRFVAPCEERTFVDALIATVAEAFTKQVPT